MQKTFHPLLASICFFSNFRLKGPLSILILFITKLKNFPLLFKTNLITKIFAIKLSNLLMTYLIWQMSEKITKNCFTDSFLCKNTLVQRLTCWIDKNLIFLYFAVSREGFLTFKDIQSFFNSFKRVQWVVKKSTLCR